MTIGVDFLVKRITLETNDGRKIEVVMQIWDMGGQERYSSVRPFYYKGALGAMVIFDLTRRDSFESVPKWLEEIKTNIEDPIPIILLGNKKDLEELREVEEEEAIEYADKIKCDYFETSAKTGEKVEEAYHRLAKRVIEADMDQDQQQERIEEESEPEIVNLLDDQIEEMVKVKVNEMLISKPTKEVPFRILIVGNEEAQKPLLRQLFRVEKIKWPPQAFSILYNTTRHKINIGSIDYRFQIYFLSNIEKLKEEEELFTEACKKSHGIIIFYDLSNREDFTNAVDLATNLREKDKKLEIILTAGRKEVAQSSSPDGWFQKLEELEEKYQINNHDDHVTLLSGILINVLKRKDKIDKKLRFVRQQLVKLQEQCCEELVDPEDILIEMEKFATAIKKKPSDSTKSDPDIPPPEIETAARPKDKIFISYSHHDDDSLYALERLQVFLKPIEKEGIAKRWDDTLINPGDDWLEEIQKALDSTRVAILLVSADYLASDFISNDELPPLLHAARKKGTKILPLIISHCRFNETKTISRFQAVNKPERPLMKLNKVEQDEIFYELTKNVEEAFRNLD